MYFYITFLSMLLQAICVEILMLIGADAIQVFICSYENPTLAYSRGDLFVYL
jgi:hypothetical protein